MVTNTAISVEVNFIPPCKMIIYSFYHINMQKNNINFRFIFIELNKNEMKKRAEDNECYKSKIRSLPGTDFGFAIIRMNSNTPILKKA